MIVDQIKFEQAIQTVFSREGFKIIKIPEEHAGGKWQLRYKSFTGQSGNLEVDLNYMFRQPLWDILLTDSYPLGNFQSVNIPILDLHELAAGKLVALLARGQARDLFDSHQILNLVDLDPERLRIAFVVYGGMNRIDWRTVSIKDVDFDETELIRLLVPTLTVSGTREYGPPAKYGGRLVRECRDGLSSVMPFTDSEQKFLDLLLDKGEIDSSNLTANVSLQNRIQQQPLLEWKALNVRKYKNIS